MQVIIWVPKVPIKVKTRNGSVLHLSLYNRKKVLNDYSGLCGKTRAYIFGLDLTFPEVVETVIHETEHFLLETFINHEASVKLDDITADGNQRPEEEPGMFVKLYTSWKDGSVACSNWKKRFEG